MMNKKYNVAVVGATGAVGETMLEILAERKFPVDNIYPLASERSAGDTLLYANKPHLIEDLAEFDFSKADIAQYTNRMIIANPNCSTIQMLVALKPLHDQFKINKIDVCTYQSVSGSGKAGIEELAGQTGKLLNGIKIEPKTYSQQIAFNVLPEIDVFMENGFTREEMKMIWETRKIFGDNDIIVNPTAVRVPVFYGHSEAVHIITEKPISRDKALIALKTAPGVIVVDNPEKKQYASPAKHSAGKNAVFVSRVREQLETDNGLDLWVVSDNIRKGAALNSIQIAEKLIKNYL